MYDLAIIGGGPAGYSAAFEAAKLQMRVVLFEREHLGGTCLNRGCVPTKYLSHVGKKYYEACNPNPDGIQIASAGIDFAVTSGRMERIISSLRTNLEGLLAYGQVAVVKGNAAVVDKNRVVCDEVVYEANNILITTGSGPDKPFVDGAITSDELLKMEEIPRKLHVLGGGVVAVEFAQIFRMLGSEVTMSIRAGRLLRKWDEELALAVEKCMVEKGIRIEKNCNFNDLTIEEGSVVLSALGRKPILPDAASGLWELGADGGIVVDACGQTRTKGIYAAGDVTSGSVQLAHTGMEQGKRAVRHMAGFRLAEEPVVVNCIYGDQEAVSVGITEAEARAKGREVLTTKLSMVSNARTLILGQEHGYTKLIAEKDTGKILGAQLLNERAGDMAAEIALAIDRGITVNEMLETVRPHPSFCEAVTDALGGLEMQLGILNPQKAQKQDRISEGERKGGKLRFWK